MFGKRGYKGVSLDPEEYTDEEMEEMLHDEGYQDDYDALDEVAGDAHPDEQRNWLDLLCQCKAFNGDQIPVISFIQLKEVSKKFIILLTIHANQVVAIDEELWVGRRRSSRSILRKYIRIPAGRLHPKLGKLLHVSLPNPCFEAADSNSIARAHVHG